MKRRDLEKILLLLGWRLYAHGRRHDAWARGDDKLIVTRREEIDEVTARIVLMEAEGG